MAFVPLGVFLGGCITAIPVVTGVAEGVSHQKKQNEEAANETRMIKFNILVECDSKDPLADEIRGGIAVLRHDKVRFLRLFRPPLLSSLHPVPHASSTFPMRRS